MKDKIQNNLKFVCELIGLRFQHLMMFRLGFWGPFLWTAVCSWWN